MWYIYIELRIQAAAYEIVICGSAWHLVGVKKGCQIPAAFFSLEIFLYAVFFVILFEPFGVLVPRPGPGAFAGDHGRYRAGIPERSEKSVNYNSPGKGCNA